MIMLVGVFVLFYRFMSNLQTEVLGVSLFPRSEYLVTPAGWRVCLQVHV